MSEQLIKRQLIQLTVLLLIAAFTISALVFQNQFDRRINSLANTHEILLSAAEEILLEEFVSYETNIRLLRYGDAVTAGLASGQAIQNNSLAESFRQYAILVPNVTQLRWLDDTGMEQVRVDVVDGTPTVLPQSRLQNKEHRYYFLEAMATASEDVYVSRIDLNVENGKLVVPLQPTVRVAIRTGVTDDTRQGLLVVNYNLADKFDQLADLSTNRVSVQIFNDDGYWMLNPDRAKEWGDQLRKPEFTLANTNAHLWQQIKNNPSSFAYVYEGTLMSHRSHQYSSTSSGRSTLHIVALSASVVLNSERWRFFWVAFLVFVFVTTLLGIVLVRIFKARAAVVKLTDQLTKEKSDLLTLNKALDNALKNQQLLQDELVQSRKLASLGLTVAGVAHELNTPLGGAVLSLSGLRSMVADLDASVSEGLTREALLGFIANSQVRLSAIEENLQRARSVVQSFKRLAFERAKEEFVEFSLAELVGDLMTAIQYQLPTTQLKLINSVPETLNMVSEPGLVSQVLENLITNSIEHGFDPDQAGIVQVEAKEMANNKVEIRVTDNGKGILLSSEHDIYEPFVTGARGSGHIGLGMYLVHQWVTSSLQGSIQQVTPEGGGCQFIIQLPRCLTHANP